MVCRGWGRGVCCGMLSSTLWVLFHLSRLFSRAWFSAWQGSSPGTRICLRAAARLGSVCWPGWLHLSPPGLTPPLAEQ